MTKEQEEAIKYFKECIKKDTTYEENLTISYMKTVLFMLKEKDKELEKKEKIIDEMAETIIEDTAKLDTFWCNGCFKLSKCPFENAKQCVINYFEKKEEE